MRRYLKGSETALDCEMRRYNTGGIVMRWPVEGAQEVDVWFTCTIRQTQGLFVIKTFLRHTPAAPAQAAMVLVSQTLSVEVGLLQEPELHCQFAVDHKLPNATVEWRLLRHSERTKLFSYSSRTGKREGQGVTVKTIAGGNASFKVSPTRKHSEGTYTCSVMVPPLYGSHDIPLSLKQPRVSVNVGSTLSLTLGQDQKLICDAERYYPLDVTIEWYREPHGGSPTPLFLKNVLYSSHRHHQDGTYSLSAFFYLQPDLEDSGYKYTCRVSHKSLLNPIRKSFYLVVSEPDSTMWYITAVGFIIAMLVVLACVLPQYVADPYPNLAETCCFYLNLLHLLEPPLGGARCISSRETLCKLASLVAQHPQIVRDMAAAGHLHWCRILLGLAKGCDKKLNSFVQEVTKLDSSNFLPQQEVSVPVLSSLLIMTSDRRPAVSTLLQHTA
ncbi:hypothetical protein DNTS_017754 [Danionella cerebrum]|uniref:Ig-like domain-containing protein n=1 Tax=Danionella cerebrum TaxID=2873325 RepID=A0A553NH14_9TELE|nr:hypothetical protein DNTS_017754 [Danionella translucida]